MLYLFDQEDEFITLLSKETGLVDAWFKDYQNHIIDEPFTFKIKSSSPKLKYIESDNQVAFHDRDGKLRLMRMKQLYEETSQEESVIRVICEPSYLELYDHFIEDRRITNGTAQTALNRALEGSRYVGEVAVELGLSSDNFYWIDGVDAVFRILENWGGALKDTITLDADNEIIERKIWIVQRLGADNGLIVEPDFNAEFIERKTLSYVETALWGQGSSLEITDDEEEHTGGYTRYITFEDVVWSKSNGDPVDKPKGQKWVGDPQALNEYGYLHNGIRKHRYGHFSNQDYETPEELLMATWLELQERKLKEIIHEATINPGDKKVSLGDTVTILNRKYNKPIELQSQITGLEYDILDDEEVTIVIGKYIDMNKDPLRQEVDDLKNQVSKPTKPITDVSFPDIVPGIPVSIDAVGGIGVIQLYWDYDSKVYISHYEVYGSQIADFVPDSQHLLYRGRVSAFAHIVDTDEKWYYYLRAVNTRGTPSGFSVRVEASSVRVITDDILFGSIIADHLSNNLDIADKLAQNTIDRINEGPMQAIEYTNQEIIDTENRLLGQLNTEIGDVNTSISDLNSVADNLKNRANATDDLLSQHGGKFVSIEQEINEIDGRISTTINKVDSIDNTVQSHGLELVAQADLISAKLDSLEYLTDKTGIVNRIESNELNIQATAAGLNLRVTKEEFEALEIGGRNLLGNTGYERQPESYQSTITVVEGNPNQAIVDGRGIVTDRITTLVLGERYTISAEIRTDHHTSFNYNYVMDRVGGNHSGGVPNFTNVKPDGEWHKYFVTFISGISRTNVGVMIADGSNMPFEIRKLQLEKGNKATDWEEAPEDTEVEIGEIRNRVTTTETTLGVHAGWINAKAERNEVYTRTETNGLLGDKVDFNEYSNKMTNLDLTIDGLNTTVSNTSATVNDLSGEIVNAQSQIANLDIRAGGIELGVSNLQNDLVSTQNDIATINIKADGIISTVENIQIGGRNLLRNTDFDVIANADKVLPWAGNTTISSHIMTGSKKRFIRVHKTDGSPTAVTGAVISSDSRFYVSEGESYTLSFVMRPSANANFDFSYVHLMYGSSDISNQNISSGGMKRTPFKGYDGTTLYRYEVTFQPNHTEENAYILIGTRGVISGVTSFFIQDVQLEKGTTASDWEQAPEDADARMTKSESSISQLSDEIDIKVDKNGVVASINVSPEGVRINGNRHHITGQTLIDDAVIGTAAMANLSVTNAKMGLLSVGTAQLQNAAITNAKIGNLAVDDAKIASLSVTKLLAGEIDTNKIKIRGGSAIDYTLIDGSYFESRGRFSRTWKGSTATNDIKFRFQNGYLRARNDTEDRSLYISDYGVSTAVDGTLNDAASGTLQFFDTQFESARGVTLHSHFGVVALQSDNNRVIISPQSTSRSGTNHFNFRVKDNTWENSDGWISFGDISTATYHSGIRFSKNSGSYTIYATNGDGDIGTGNFDAATFVGELRPRGDYNYLRATRTRLVRPGTATDNYADIQFAHALANTIRVNDDGANFYIGTSTGEVRVTNNLLHNGGNIGYRPIRASSFPTGTSLRENKVDIEAFDESALDTLRNITPYLYRIKGDEGNPYKQLGLMVDETPRYLHGEAGDSMEMYALGTFAIKGIKELDTKVIKIEDRLDEKDLQIQFLTQKIRQLEENAA